MKRRTAPAGAGGAKLPVVHQTSAGGIAYKMDAGGPMVAIVSVGEKLRWQLPKGLVENGETPESAAVRETLEEAGIEGEVEAPLDKIEYWYAGPHEGQRVRFHKIVHFFLLRYKSGDVEQHDFEVNEARWVTLRDAASMLSFSSEKKILEIAARILASSAR